MTINLWPLEPKIESVNLCGIVHTSTKFVKNPLIGSQVIAVMKICCARMHTWHTHNQMANAKTMRLVHLAVEAKKKQGNKEENYFSNNIFRSEILHPSHQPPKAVTTSFVWASRLAWLAWDLRVLSLSPVGC